MSRPGAAGQPRGGSGIDTRLLAILGLLLCCGIPALPIYLWRKGKLNAQWGIGLAAGWVALVLVAVAVTPTEEKDEPADKTPAALADVPTSAPPESLPPTSAPAPTEASTSSSPTPKPKPKPKPKPEPKPEPKPKPKPKPEPSPEPEPEMDPIFGTCGEANDNGYGNYSRGVDPEYGYYDDRDGDGVVCEF